MIKTTASLCLLIPLLSGCKPVESLLIEPKISPEQWCDSMPCVEIFSTGIILNQPISTVLVYLLGALWLWASWRFWASRGDEKSRLWWSLSLALGGVAAIVAGSSYQAFGYELKCAGREFCLWTNGWEITYMVLQLCCMNAMLIAVVYSCTTGWLRQWLIRYAAFNSAVHFLITLLGVYLANKFMLSFELVVLFSAPGLVMCLVINGRRYLREKQPLDLILLGCWGILLLTNLFYFAYLLLGFTQVLWQQGLWFSENDVLHVLMLAWVLYTGLVVAPVTVDAETPRPLSH